MDITPDKGLHPQQPINNDTQERPAPDLTEQAVLLFGEGGWRYKSAHTCPDIFFLHGPDGECHIVILATALPYESYCTCPGFRREKSCVHILALEHERDYLDRIEAMEREQEERQHWAEHPRFGCDEGFHYDRAAY